MKRRLRNIFVISVMVAVIILPAASARADFLFSMRLDVLGYPSSFRICATASTGTAAATDITINLDVEGASSTLTGAQPLVSAPTQTVLNATSVQVCSGSWNLGASPTGSVHIATTAAGTNLLATTAGHCEGTVAWILGASPTIVKGC